MWWITKNNSRAISEGLLIYADEFEFNQKTNILSVKANVKIDDQVEDYILEADYISYKKNLDQIITVGNTKLTQRVIFHCDENKWSMDFVSTWTSWLLLCLPSWDNVIKPVVRIHLLSSWWA